MIAALILLPVMAGLATFGIRPAGPRRALLLAAAVEPCRLDRPGLGPPAGRHFGWLAVS